MTTTVLDELMAPLMGRTTYFRPKAMPRKRAKSLRPRDSQRSKLYKTEAIFFARKPEVGHVGTGDIPEVQEWVDSIIAQPWFKARYGAMRVRVKAGPGSNAEYHGRIQLTREGRKRWIVIHELAHVVASPSTVAAHGPEFCEAYLWLVGHVFGHELAIGLTEAFDAAGISYHPPDHSK